MLVLSIYLIHLSYREYSASIQAEKSADEIFEMGQNYSSESFRKMFNINITSIESNEYKIAQIEYAIEYLKNDVNNNWWTNLWVEWKARVKMHFYMGLVTILMTVLSWKIDNLTYNKK